MSTNHRISPRQFGVRLRLLRERAGLSPRELAEKAAISESYVRGLETGNKRNLPVVETLARIADALGVTIAVLLGEAPPPPTQAEVMARVIEEALETTGGILFRVYGVPSAPGRWIAEEGRGVPVPREWIGTRDPDEFLLVRAHGDDLRHLDIVAGSYVLIDRRADVAPGERAAVLVERDGAHLLIEYAAQTFDDQTVIGRAIKSWVDL